MSKIKDFVICVIFEHNLDEGKAKSRSNAVAFQVILTQSSAKFTKNQPIYPVKTGSYNLFLEFVLVI